MSKHHKQTSNAVAPRPVKLFDHLPGILAGIPAVGLAILALLQLGNDGVVGEMSFLESDTIFWIALGILAFWYVAVRFNLPKKRFFQVFGLLGTFIGIPVALELAGVIRFFGAIGDGLGAFRPTVSAGAWAILAIVFTGVWLVNLIWSRTHMRVEIKDGQLTITRAGGKRETFDLIGLKTEEEPLDYSETFIGGFGKLALKTRTGKLIFQMNRVFGLYWIWWMPWRKSLLKRIHEALSVDGKFISQQAAKAEVLEAMDDVDAEALDDDDPSEDDYSEESLDQGDHEEVEREVR